MTVVGASTTATGAVVEDSAATASATDSDQATGTIAFTDVDLADSHAASFAAAPANTTSLGAFALGTVNEAANAAGGTVGWTYTINEAAAQYLAAGQVATEVYTVTLNDGNGSTTTQDVTVTITGTNDAPVLTAITAKTYNDTPNDDSFAAHNGTLSATDVDATDTLSYSIDGDAGDITLAGFNRSISSTYGKLYLNSVTGAYRFVPDDAQIEGLKTGTNVSFTMRVTDSSGAANNTDAKTFMVNLNGVNDIANITVTPSGDYNVTEAGAAGAGDPTASGDLDVSDRDFADVGFSTPAPAALQGVYGTFTFNAATGAWSYTLNNLDPDTEALGSTDNVTDTLTVLSADGTDSETITVHIAGANDNLAPDAVNDNFAASEAAIETATILSRLQVGNVITNNDSDPNGDALTVASITIPIVTESDAQLIVTSVTGQTAGGGEIARYQILTTTGTAILAVSTNGAVTMWSTAGDAFRGLGVGESASIGFNYTISDGHGGSDTATTTITVNGTNDVPTATSNTFATTEDAVQAATSVGTAVIAGNLLTAGSPDSDPDGDSLTVTAISSVALNETDAELSVSSITAVSAEPGEASRYQIVTNSGTALFAVYANGEVRVWTTAGDPFAGLGVGETASIDLVYTISDGHGGTSSANGSVTIAGNNDAPAGDPTAADLVLTSAGNNKAFVIPEWALVANDFDPDSLNIDVQAGSVINASSGTTAHTPGTGNAGFVTFTDDALAAGSFQYQATDGTTVGTLATVTINNLGSTGNNITGTNANEIMIGTDNKDNFTGAGGNDIIIGAAGGGTYIGGTGSDIIQYREGANNGSQTVIHGDSGSAAAGTDSDTLKIIETTSKATNLSIAANQAVGVNFTTITGFENIDASLSSGVMTLTGSTGSNRLIGGSAGDTITGGVGADTMTGNGGADTFIIATGQSLATVGGSGDAGTLTGYDVISDFSGAADFLDLDGSPIVATGSNVNGADSTLTVVGATVKSHTISNGIITFDDSDSYAAALSLNGLDASRVAAAVQYLKANDIGNAGATVAFNATINGVAHTYVYQQIATTPNGANDILVDLVGVTLTSGGTSLQTLINNTHIKPAGVAGTPINLALTDPSSDPNDVITVAVSGMPEGWSLAGGTRGADGTWAIQTHDVTSLSVVSPEGYAGALVLTVVETWTGTDGNSGAKIVSDNVEAFAIGAPIFAWSGDDTLTGSDAADLFVFSQPIGDDTVHAFDTAADTIDLIGYGGFGSFADVLAHTTDDAAGNARLELADGQSITFMDVHTADLTASNFVFNVQPVMSNASAITLGDGSLLPMSGMLENSGTITLQGHGTATQLQIIQQGLTLTGGGSLTMSDSANNEISGPLSSVILTNVDNTISGAGQLGAGSLTLINEGTIVANGVNALVIDTGSNTIVNTGTLSATGAGGLIVSSGLDNEGNLIAHDSSVTVHSSVLGNGTITLEGHSSVTVGGAIENAIVFTAGASGTLGIGDGEHVSGSIAGFDGDDVVDFLNTFFDENSSVSYQSDADSLGGTVTVSDGVHSSSIHLVGSYEANLFHVSADSDYSILLTYGAQSPIGG